MTAAIRRRRARAFTLMEVMLALSVGAIIAAGATFGMVTVFKSTVQLEKQAQVDQDAKLILDAVLGQVQQIGGGVFRPHTMISIDDNAGAACATAATFGANSVPACGGSDRLHFVVLDDTAPQCTINSLSGTSLVFDGAPTSTCCTATSFSGAGLILVDEESGQWRTRTCDTYNSGASCDCVLDSTPVSYEPPGSAVDADFDIVSGGYVASVYLDRTNKVLMMIADRDGDGTPERYKLAPNVWDFQVEYGFDVDNNGEVDTRQPSFTTPTAIADRETQRLVTIGLVVGARVSSKTTATAAQVLNGDEVSEPSRYLLRSVVGSTSLRNLYLFY
jgi:prepilin-type N-terminal cleavage/methylation domain-containing protein